MFKFIKKAAMAMVADDIKAMVDAAVQQAVGSKEALASATAKALVAEDLLDMEGIIQDAAERAVDDIDVDDIASQVDIDYDELGRSLDASDVAGELDIDEIAEAIDAERVADALDYRRLAAMILERRAELARAAKAAREAASSNG